MNKYLFSVILFIILALNIEYCSGQSNDININILYEDNPISDPCTFIGNYSAIDEKNCYVYLFITNVRPPGGLWIPHKANLFNDSWNSTITFGCQGTYRVAALLTATALDETRAYHSLPNFLRRDEILVRVR